MKANFNLVPTPSALETRTGESYSSLERIISEMKQNSLRHHWAKAEEDYPAHYFIREINEGSLI